MGFWWNKSRIKQKTLSFGFEGLCCACDCDKEDLEEVSAEERFDLVEEETKVKI